ncbi:hypothetical protein GCM10011365_04900 [Marinicella pacifica]|uniref:Uncharacterized protein n=2 Tax=Marinicella pacifica TaxID=1171543 RepID=A0A917CF40_9GAMM|nr:hypothetical protein GCM10011365_04900 [Marinicella pacifica]
MSQQAVANGEITDQVNHLQDHISEYTEEVHWLLDKYNSVVDAYEKQGQEATDTQKLIDFWEEVDFHAAIETQFVPIYANVWQGIYGIKQGIDEGKTVQEVRMEQDKLNQALWQALGAVKLAANLQQRGIIEKIKTTEVEPTSAPETIDDIKDRLDRVVAKYAEQLSDVAVTLVHDTYMQRFEGIEGALIEQDAQLVEDLEKDFNVTLPQAIEGEKSVDEVRQVIGMMKQKLNKAKQLLVAAEADRQPVF